MADEPKNKPGQAQPPAAGEKTSAEPGAAATGGETSRSFKETTSLAELTVGELSSLVSAEVSKALASAGPSLAGRAGVHVNSGPPGFVNGGGHANFDPRVSAGALVNPALAAAGRAGVHVNSGPPGFVNGGGHANFDPRVSAGSVVNPALAAGRAGVHVNSGPPGFVNGGGHANFDPRVTNPGATQILTLPDGTNLEVPSTGPLDFRVRGFRITR